MTAAARIRACLVLAGTTVVVAGGLAAGARADGDDANGRAVSNIDAHRNEARATREDVFASRGAIVDADGVEHVRLERTYRGLPVVGGDVVVHQTRPGGFLGVSATLATPVSVDLRPSLSPAEAVAAATRAHGGTPSNPRLLVYAHEKEPALAYEVVVSSTTADGTPSEAHLFVDAHTGGVIDSWDAIETLPANGTGRGFFNGTVPLTTDQLSTTFRLRDPSRGSGYTCDMRNRQFSSCANMDDGDNTWGTGSLTDRQTVAVDAQYGIAMTWDYYRTVHGRLGIANDGRGAYNRVHYGNRYNNAFWSDSCFCMTYGDGDGTTFNPFDSLDVAGHEMSHGVTSRTAKLIYSGESGGLNEATSDIFGTAVEFFAANPNDPGDYLIGERLYKAGGLALRSMVNPSADGASSDCWYSTVGSLNVHYSSGVANHFFYLLAEGTTNGSPSKTCAAGNTRVATGNGTVAGIGRSKAERIWYRALTVYMTSGTTYAAARTATTNAANDLYGVGSPESNAVAAAWTAVGRS